MRANLGSWALLALIAILVAGCESVETVGRRYRLERDNFHAMEALARAQKGGAQINPQLLEKIRQMYLKLESGSAGVTPSDSISFRILGQAALTNVDLLAGLRRPKDAQEALAAALEKYKADPVVHAEALSRRARSSMAGGDTLSALEDLRTIPTLVRPDLSVSGSVGAQVMELPFTITQFVWRKDGPVRGKEEARKSLDYYLGVVQASGPHSREGLAARAYAADVQNIMGDPASALESMEILQTDCRAIPSESQRTQQLLLSMAATASDRLGDTRRAHGYLDRLGHDFPRSPFRARALLYRARLFHKERRNDESIKAYRALADDGTVSEDARALAWSELGAVMELQNNWEAAADAYDQASRNFPLTQEGLSAPMRKAAHFASLKNAAGLKKSLEDARTYYVDVLARYGDSPIANEIRRRLIQSQLQLQDWTGAAKTMEQMALKLPDGPIALQVMLDVAKLQEQKLHDNAASTNALRRILARFPKAPFRDQLQAQIKKLGG